MLSEFVFLIGSGLSCAAGLPSVDKLTDEIFDMENVFKHSDNHFYKNKSKPSIDHFPEYYEYNEVIEKILKITSCEIEKYYGNNYKANYEEIYYLVKQIEDKFEYDNPAMLAFIEKVNVEIKSLLKGYVNFNESIRNSVKYIEDTIWHILAQKFENSIVLNFILEKISEVNFVIFSLNYDYLIEQILQEYKIEFINGFKTLNERIKIWDDNLFDQKSRIKLYKLHGSVSWVRYIIDNFKGYFYADIGLNDIYLLKDNKGDYLRPPAEGPRFLIGSVNKILEYSRELFSELFYRFHCVLKNTNLLIVIGYGFKDKGINSKIIEYMYYNFNNKIIIVDKKEKEELLKDARFAIQNNIPKWENEKRLRFICKDIKDFSLDEIKD
ncbi:MAG: SIR2 family protein [Actinobacteria bacterium]|nr:SIR2 family protein [Actinomycetota bacterium]MCL6088373.1 SIR2 family protein [Actinomycetota bacterium]